MLARVGAYIAALVGIGTIVGGVWYGADALNVRFVMKFEQQELRDDLQEDIQQLAGMTLEDLLVRKRRRLFEVEAAVALYQSGRQTVPDKLIDELNLLRDEIRVIERRLGK